MRLGPIVLAAVTLAAYAPRVYADGVTPDPVALDLFDQGRRLVQQNKCAEAIAKFEQSLRKSRTVGAMLNLAECQSRLGRTATAWAAFRAAAAIAKESGDVEREKYAASRASALEPKLSKLTIAVPPESRVPGLEIKRADAVVAAEEWDAAIAVDPGTYTLRATAPGHAVWTRDVTVNDGGRFLVTIPVLAAETQPLVVPPATPESAPAVGTSADKPAAPHSSPQRPIAIGVAAAGVVGLGLGTFFGLQAKSKNSGAEPHCQPVPTRCDAEGVRLGSDAHSAATMSTIAFIAGGALLAGGAVLYLTARAPRSVAVRVGPGAVLVGGAF